MPSDPEIVRPEIVHKDADWQALENRIRERTPARLMQGRTGASYRTATQLQLRADHAAARDAVQNELDLSANFGQEFIERWRIFEVSTRATSKSEYLLRPDLGRTFDEAARSAIREQCPHSPDLQIVIGDGLSVRAISAQVPGLLPLLFAGAGERGWSVGRPFVVRHCRVGVMNEIGELLAPAAVVLLIGERPGLASVESLSAYLAYRPRNGHTDANRNLVSNIRQSGAPLVGGAARILNMIQAMLKGCTSGVHLKEESFRPILK
jgi:ethanolamine ammonia-lyase small subunit